jgi:hypothetical protein
MNVFVLVENISSKNYSAYMDYNSDLGFALTGYGITVDDAIKDFNQAYEKIKIARAEKGQENPEVKFDFYEFKRVN